MQWSPVLKKTISSPARLGIKYFNIITQTDETRMGEIKGCFTVDSVSVTYHLITLKCSSSGVYPVQSVNLKVMCELRDGENLPIKSDIPKLAR